MTITRDQLLQAGKDWEKLKEFMMIPIKDGPPWTTGGLGGGREMCFIPRTNETRKDYLQHIRGEKAQETRPLIRRVYIAGPMTLGDTGANVTRGMEAAHRLMDHGLSPLCPHLTHFLHIMRPRPYKEWVESDFPWLEVSDAVLRLPGESKGADKEEELAGEWGIPVFINEEALYKEVELRRKARINRRLIKELPQGALIPTNQIPPSPKGVNP